MRNAYQLHRDYRVDLFNRKGGGLPAFHPLSRRHLVDWRYFFEIEDAPPPNFNWSRRIDPLVTVGLHQLHNSNVVGPADLGSLPARNLQRGRVFFLPSGQEVASRILPVLEERGALNGAYGGKGRGPRGSGGWEAFLLQPGDRVRHFLGGEETPLWYYILEEAEVFGVSRQVYYTPAYATPYRGGPRLQPAGYAPGPEGYGAGGRSLGPVGGTIVGEVLIGLLEHFREKTGKGLAYQPEVRGSTSGYGGGPGKGRDRPRYLMRNLLLDAGVVQTY